MLYLPYEIWRDIKWYEWLYQISNLWRLKWLIRKWIIKEVILKQSENNVSWYKQITLSKEWNKKTYRIHRLIGLHYIKEIKWKDYINHINWIRTDNRIENLERCTSSENHLHKYRVLWYSHSIKQREAASKTWKIYIKKIQELWTKAVSKKVLQYTKDMVFIKEFKSLREAARCLNIHRCSIWQCCRLHKSYQNVWWFIFRYK